MKVKIMDNIPVNPKPLLQPDEVEQEINRSIEYLESEQARLEKQISSVRNDLERFYASRAGIQQNKSTGIGLVSGGARYA